MEKLLCEPFGVSVATEWRTKESFLLHTSLKLKAGREKIDARSIRNFFFAMNEEEEEESSSRILSSEGHF